MFGRRQERIKKVSSRSLEGISRVSGMSLENFCMEFGRSLGCTNIILSVRGVLEFL